MKTASSGTLKSILAVSAMSLGVGSALAEHPAETAAEHADSFEVTGKRHEIDAIAAAALDDLLSGNRDIRDQYDKSAGYAVFDATKAGLILTGGGGTGVAVDLVDLDRVYMNMGTGGVGLGVGLQNFRLVMLFETQADVRKFIDGGWDAAVSAQAAAGKAGSNFVSSFVDGVAVYQLTNKGLMAQADVMGTRFWVSDDLNE